MVRTFPDEIWKKVEFEPEALIYNYAVSNFGRLVSYTDEIENGRLLRGGLLSGYPTFVSRPFGKSRTLYLHKLVARLFISKEAEGETYVIHKDYNKKNNHIDNLKWASKKEVESHQQNSPFVKESRDRRKNIKPTQGHKLSSTDVMRIKKKIFDPNRRTRLKLIAKQFGISEMQLYRIKSGENWSHISVNGKDHEMLKGELSKANTATAQR